MVTRLSLIIIALTATVANARELLDLPEATVLRDTAVIPLYDTTDGTQKITGAKVKQQVLEIRQGADEADTTPKLRVYDKTGKLRCTIFANGSIGIE